MLLAIAQWPTYCHDSNGFPLTQERHPMSKLSTFTVLLTIVISHSSLLGEESALILKPSADGHVELFPAPALYLHSLSSPLRGQLAADPVQNRIMSFHGEQSWHPVVDEVMTTEKGSEARWQVLDAEAVKKPFEKRVHGSYLHVTVAEPADRVALFSGSGIGMFYLNGEPHAGELYRRGIIPIPVKLRKGENHFLMLIVDSQPRARLTPRATEISFSGNHVLPDLPEGEAQDYIWGGVGICNATEKTTTGLSIRVTREGVPPLRTAIAALPPLTTLRVAYKLPGGAPASKEQTAFKLELLAADEQTVLQATEVKLKTVDPYNPRDPYRRTFLSQIDGSVQYYAIKRAAPGKDDPTPAMILTLHGASIEAASHVTHIGGKSWAHLISPTNRGTYGFDWEDYGRKDALEALADAQQHLRYDPTRVYLSGHSMGGHGTWSIGSLFPNRFAAIGPSAGWVSYWSYRGHPPFDGPTAIDSIMRRPMLASDTEKLLPNLKDRAVYVLHGNSDNNVPAAQSRRMAELLAKFHHDWIYREEGGSHFWNSKESDSSTACVDWPEMMQSFARHVLPPDAAVRSLEFVTPNPRVTSQLHWLTVHAQVHHGELSRVKAWCWPLKREFEAETENVAVLRLDTKHLRTQGPITVRLDGKGVVALAPDNAGGIWFERSGGEWRAANSPAASTKGPHRYGPVKEEVDRRFVVVYGTKGDAAENASMLAKARYDAETFLSRGNCSGEILPDSSFQPEEFKDRSVLLIGNADTNSAWPVLLPNCPVSVRRGEIRIGEKLFSGDDLAAMFVQPRPDSDTASVVAIAGTGPIGMQFTYRWSLFVPFVRFPDCLVAQSARTNQEQPKTLAAGYFGRDWSVTTGDFAYDEEPKN